MNDDAREHPRYEIDASADLSGSGGHRIQNISLGGICIQTSAIEEVGAPVDVVLNLGEAGPRIAIHGQVVWVNREPPEDVGIRWTGLDDKRRAALSAYIDRVRSISARARRDRRHRGHAAPATSPRTRDSPSGGGSPAPRGGRARRR